MRQLLFDRLWLLRSRYGGIVFPFLFYLLASQLSQTLLYTIVTYLVSLSAREGAEFTNTVNEISGQYVFVSLAIGAGLLSFTLHQADRALYRARPFWNDGSRPLWQLERARKDELFRGLSSGSVAALGYLLIFAASGQLSYLGVYITSTLGTPIFPLFFINLLALVSFLCSEEYIFRHRILRGLLQELPAGSALFLTCGLQVLARHSQFHLDWVDAFNLALLSAASGWSFARSGRCQRGFGFQVALLCLLHNFAGLSLWGNESPSFFLVKAVAKAPQIVHGGSSGPFGGLGISAILLLLGLGSYLTRGKAPPAPAESPQGAPGDI